MTMQYDEALRRVEGLIKHKAGRVHARRPALDFDDLVQEGRIAVAGALEVWDGVRPWHVLVGVYLDNRFRDLARGAMVPTRCPRVAVQHVDGAWRVEACPPVSLDPDNDCNAAPGPSPEEALLQLEDAREAKVRRLRLRGRLTPFQRTVFDLWLDPPPALVDFAWRASGSRNVLKVDIAGYLDVDKRQVEYAMRCIRTAAREVLGS